MDAAHYTYNVEWSNEDAVFVARVVEFPGIAAHGDTQDAALAEARVALELGLEMLQDSGKPIPAPLSERRYSGKILLRVSPTLHRRAVALAESEGESLNMLVTAALAERLGREGREWSVRKPARASMVRSKARKPRSARVAGEVE